MTGRARLGLAVGAVIALAATPPAVGASGLLAGPPSVRAVEVQAPASGPLAGRVILDVATAHPEVAARAGGRIDLTRATHVGLVRVRLRGAGGKALASVGSREPLLLRSPGRRVAYVHRVVLSASASAALRAAAADGPVRAQIVAQSRLVRGGTGRPAQVSSATRASLLPPPSAWRSRLTPRPRPTCDRSRERATAGRSTLLALRCMGDAPRVALADGPRLGGVSVVRSAPGATLVRYQAPAKPGGSDQLVMRATNEAGSTVTPLPVTVRPFTMRAIGDSVTAGFGFMGDGTPMSVVQLPFCIPPDALNDRCSSNSSNGPSSGGPPAWSSDFGYGNQVAWSAQFAQSNGISSAAFENRAVSGAAPVDWDTGGQLNDTLAGVVADDPDLTVMTLGANPLLDLFLAGRGLGCAATLSDAAFRACIQGYITQQQLVPRLRSVIAQLLVAPGNRVVVSQYHLAIPSATIYSVSSLRILSAVLNDNLAAAVQGAPGYGSRLFLISPPLFPVGVAPGDALCPGEQLSSLVDGPSRQSDAAQDELEVTYYFSGFCGSTDYWIISADTGIHPSVAGHAQFAAALQAVVDENDLGPPAP